MEMGVTTSAVITIGMIPIDEVVIATTETTTDTIIGEMDVATIGDGRKIEETVEEGSVGR